MTATPEAGPEQGTANYPTVTDFRRSLVTQAVRWETDTQTYGDVVMASRHGGRAATSAERDAYLAALMAGGYAYTIAALIKMAEQKFGPGTAYALACTADEILTNGDFAEWNADVAPPATAPKTGE